MPATVARAGAIFAASLSGGVLDQPAATTNFRSFGAFANPGNDMNQPDIRSFEELLAVVADPGASESAVDSALEALSRQPAKEAPAFWIAVVVGPNQPSWHRRRALLTFFRRFATGMPLDILVAIPGIGRVLASDHLYDRTMAAKLPFDRHRGASVIMLRPELPDGDDTAIYLLFSQPISPAQLADLAAAGWAHSGNSIVSVGISG